MQSSLSVDLAINVPSGGPRFAPQRGNPFFAVGVVPIAGPLVLAAGEGGDPGGTAIFVVDGILQAAGLAMLIAGLAARTHVLVRQEGHVVALPAPLSLGKNGTGLGLTGTF